MNLTNEEFIANEEELSYQIIYNLSSILDKDRNKIGITYISTLGIDSPKRFIIFHPFIHTSSFYPKYFGMSYFFISEFAISVSNNFYKYIYEYENKFKKSVIGIIKDEKLSSWEIYNSGDSKDLFILENSIKEYYNTFNEWMTTKNKKNYKIHLKIANPMSFRMPFMPNNLEIVKTQGIFRRIPKDFCNNQ